MGSDVFFHGLAEGESSEIKISEGNSFLINLISISKPDINGYRTVAFEINGNRKEVKIKDKTKTSNTASDDMLFATPDNPYEIGASIPGNIYKILVAEGEAVKENQNLMIIEAMKMETTITAKMNGVIGKILVKEETQVKSGQLLMEFKK